MSKRLKLTKISRGIIFYLMLWLRPIVLRVGKVVSGFFIFVFILGFIQKLLMPTPIGWNFIIGLGLTSFAIFWLTESYDNILLRLNPTGNTLILRK
ncbi:hypothetical protein [Nostoc sp. MG11]|uniref:hypothetical protein n=1 Tax=Nostoc sp. MG11 TaxID=2721166 RepID=UPI001866F23D|nr:hypothetical protein [Nostoc sp. MG11]